MAYTDIDKPSDYFNTVLYTGNAGTQSITGVGFQPDFFWGKSRSNSKNHALHDSVRGVTKRLISNTTGAEATVAASVTAFGSDGFSLGSDTTSNANGNTFVAWNWKAGTSGSGTTTGSGTGKAYSYSVSTTAGFSIIKYIGNGTANHTIPHHIGAAPKMVIIKKTSAIDTWMIGHQSIGFTHSLQFKTDAAADRTEEFNDVAPTSTVVNLGSGGEANGNDTNLIMYAFAEKQGYSKFGSYTGNGNNDGTFVYTGQKSAFVLVKRTDATANWSLIDNTRDPFNVTYHFLEPNVSDAEFTPSGPQAAFDFCSQGFKCRSTNGAINASGGTYIYMAFAENPFVTSTGIPATAR
jgi:hypothetical protein